MLTKDVKNDLLTDQINDNTKPSVRVGRKAYGSHVDSRVAEISSRLISGPGFFAASGGKELFVRITIRVHLNTVFC